MGTLANSEDPDEMPHCAAFHQDLHCLPRQKQPSGTKTHHSINPDRHPLKIQNGQFHTYCINMNGIIHQNEKG